MTSHLLTPSPPHQAKRLDFLDGLRGLAALGVVAHHFTAAYYPTSMTGDPATAHLPGNWEAAFAASPVHVLLNFRVCFFFVLSGLVLAESTARAPHGLRTLLAQLVRRYVRLGAPVAVGVAMAYVLLLTHSFYNQKAAAVSGAAWLAQFWQWVPGVGQFLADSLFGVMMSGESRYNPVLWTMVVEWRGSLLVLGLLALTSGRPRLPALYAALALLFTYACAYVGLISQFLYADWVFIVLRMMVDWRGWLLVFTLLALASGHRWRLWLYAALALVFTLGRLNFYYVAFLLGLSLHDIYRRDWAARLSPLWRRLLVAGLLLAAVVSAGHPQIYYHGAAKAVQFAWMRLPGVSPDRTVQFYHTLGAVALLAAVLLSARLRRLTMWPPLRRVGKRAFSLYITHFLLLGSGSAWVFLKLQNQFSYHASFGLMALLSLPVLVVSTEVFYRWVDVPSHTLARWLGRRLLPQAE